MLVLSYVVFAFLSVNSSQVWVKLGIATLGLIKVHDKINRGPKNEKDVLPVYHVIMSKQNYRVKTISTDFNRKTEMLTLPPNWKLFFHKRLDANNGSKCWLLLFSLSMYAVFRSNDVTFPFKFICTLVTTQSATKESNGRIWLGLGHSGQQWWCYHN